MLDGNKIKEGQRIRCISPKHNQIIGDMVFIVTRKIKEEKKGIFEGLYIVSEKHRTISGKLFKEDYERWEVVDGEKK